MHFLGILEKHEYCFSMKLIIQTLNVIMVEIKSNDKNAKNRARNVLLQNDIQKIVNWSTIWLLKFHPDKCVHLGVGPCNAITDYHSSVNGCPMKRKICEKEVPKN